MPSTPTDTHPSAETMSMLANMWNMIAKNFANYDFGQKCLNEIKGIAVQIGGPSMPIPLADNVLEISRKRRWDEDANEDHEQALILGKKPKAWYCDIFLPPRKRKGVVIEEIEEDEDSRNAPKRIKTDDSTDSSNHTISEEEIEVISAMLHAFHIGFRVVDPKQPPREIRRS